MVRKILLFSCVAFIGSHIIAAGAGGLSSVPAASSSQNQSSSSSSLPSSLLAVSREPLTIVTPTSGATPRASGETSDERKRAVASARRPARIEEEVIRGKLLSRRLIIPGRQASDSQPKWRCVCYTLQDESSGEKKSINIYEEIDHSYCPCYGVDNQGYALKPRISFSCCGTIREEPSNPSDVTITIRKADRDDIHDVRLPFGGRFDFEHRIPCEITLKRADGKVVTYSAWEVFSSTQLFKRYGKEFGAARVRHDEVVQGKYIEGLLISSRFSGTMEKVGYYIEHADGSKGCYTVYECMLKKQRETIASQSVITIVKCPIQRLDPQVIPPLDSRCSWLYTLYSPEHNCHVVVASPERNPNILLVKYGKEIVAVGTPTTSVTLAKLPGRPLPAPSSQPQRSGTTSVRIPDPTPLPGMVPVSSSSRDLSPSGMFLVPPSANVGKKPPHRVAPLESGAIARAPLSIGVPSTVSELPALILTPSIPVPTSMPAENGTFVSK